MIIVLRYDLGEIKVNQEGKRPKKISCHFYDMLIKRRVVSTEVWPNIRPQ